MNHVTIIKMMVGDTASFTYFTYNYAVRFSVVGGEQPVIKIEGCGDIRGEIIPITGDFEILNGQGQLLSRASYNELIKNKLIPARSSIAAHPQVQSAQMSGKYYSDLLQGPKSVQHMELANRYTVAALEYFYQNNPDGKFVVGLYPEKLLDQVGHVFANSVIEATIREDGWAVDEYMKRMEAVQTSSKGWLINSPDLYFYTAKRTSPGQWEFSLYQSPNSSKNIKDRLYASKIMEPWGETAASQLDCLIGGILMHSRSGADYTVAVLDATNPENKLQALVYIPDSDNRVLQVVGVVYQDSGVFLGALTTKVLGELNLAVNGEWFGHYGDLKCYRLVTTDDIAFVEVPTPKDP